MPPVPIAVLASGGGSNLQALLDDLENDAAPGRVALVVSSRADAGAVERGRRAGVDVLLLREDGQDPDALLAGLRDHGIGLVVLAGWLRHLPNEVVAAFRGRILNIHPALLPAFGGPGMYGRRVHQAVLASGSRLSGPTVHLVDEQYDHGTIVAQWPVPVHAGDTPETLAARVLEAEHRLLGAVVRHACRQVAAGRAIGPLDVAAPHFVASPLVHPRFDDALVGA